LQKAWELSTNREKPKPIVTGALLLGMGVSPGPGMGKVIKHAYEAQLDGVFSDDQSAREWCKSHQDCL